MRLTGLARFAWGVLAINIVVILWGAFVRASGSGAGCGSHWPLCNGEVVPVAVQVQTVIEFTHRVTSGTAFLLVIGLLVWARRAFPVGHQVRAAAVVAVGGMVAETLAGASLVLFRWVALDISIGRMILMPVHLIITFVLLASLTLTAWWASGGEAVDLRGRSSTMWWLAPGLVGTLVMAMAGALTALGDTVLPIASLTPDVRELVTPAAHMLVSLRIWHPVMAVGVMVYVGGVLFVLRHTWQDTPAEKFAQALGLLFVAQLFVGLLNIWLHVPIWTQLTHLLLANLIWMALVLFSAAMLSRAPRAAAEDVAISSEERRDFRPVSPL